MKLQGFYMIFLRENFFLGQGNQFCVCRARRVVPPYIHRPPQGKSLPLRGRWHGEAVTEGVLQRPAGPLGTPSVSLRLTAPSEREPLEAVIGTLFNRSISLLFGHSFLSDTVVFWYNAVGCLSLPWQQGGGEEMGALTDFLMAVAASVIGHYICKWFDCHHKGN